MALNIVFLEEYTVHESDTSPIRRLGNYTGYEYTEPHEVVGRSIGADVVIVNKIPLMADTISQLPNLKLICVAATGMNNIDIEAAQRAGVAVRNAVNYSTNSVTEQTFAGVLALYKQLPYFDDYVKSGAYSASPRLFDFGKVTSELHGKKWGIVGLGNIGRTVAGVARAFGCDVSYYSTSGTNANPDFPRSTLEDLLIQSDIVSVHAPLSKDTQNLIDYHQMSLMKPSAIIVNMARGGIVNEEGLVRALNNDMIAGAALDVYSREPLHHESPLYRVKDKHKLVLTPHSAWSTKEALQRLVGKIAENIKNHKFA